MKTAVIATADGEKGAAVELLKQGEVVAVPTETVYGLAADASRPEAVVKVFEVKGRPRFDPLIVHLPDISWLERVAKILTQDEELVSRLTKQFWPGPFTIVLPKTELIPEIVTAGLDTIAVRISGHPVFKDVITAFGKPLAAPSANRFGRISPTTAQHVEDELGGRIPLIVDGGPTIHGIESTVVAVRNGQLEILRPGPITPDHLRRFGEVELGGPTKLVSSPGQLPSHYAPRTRLKLVASAVEFQPETNQKVGLLAWNVNEQPRAFEVIRILSNAGEVTEAAVNLFRYLRELDRLHLDLIVAETVPDKGIGIAINDRLRRASN